MTAIDYGLGCRLSMKDWVWLNRTGIFETPELRRFVSPFPPKELMHRISGLQNERDFASHGADLFLALSQASPVPLTDYKKLFDFGCGCGRLARLFKDFPNDLFGCDIEGRHVDWINQHLQFMKAAHSHVHLPLPYAENSFDGIISISVFTHLNEINQDRFLDELHRVSEPKARLFLTVHGSRALERALDEESVRKLMVIDENSLEEARRSFTEGKHAFILQQNLVTRLRWRLKNALFQMRGHAGHPMHKFMEYGITFIPEGYVRSHWGQWFEIEAYHSAAIHDFQDIVVLTPKK